MISNALMTRTVEARLLPMRMPCGSDQPLLRHAPPVDPPDEVSASRAWFVDDPALIMRWSHYENGALPAQSYLWIVVAADLLPR